MLSLSNRLFPPTAVPGKSGLSSLSRRCLRALLLCFAAALTLVGNAFAQALTPGTVVGWGNNYHGQTNIPAGLTGVTAIAAGHEHSLALKTDGTVVGWGFNFFGQADSPAGLSGVTAIAAGGFHNLALKTDGTVVAWGYNDFGQTDVPAGLTGVKAIAAGGYHNLALKTDGTVVGWGPIGQSYIPAGLTGVIAIAAGTNHNLALKTDGTVVGWGNNDHGQTSIPAGLTGAKAIEAGGYHSLAANTTAPADVSPPTVDNLSPYEAATYRVRDQVQALYSCSDNVAVASCTGTVPHGSLIDTKTLGAKQFTITAVDSAGNTTVKTINYTVIASARIPPGRGKP
jgi:hypothetical protein